MSGGDEGTVEVTRTYYNSDDADHFYYQVWGGEDLHIGIYESEEESIFDASRRSVERMASKVPGLGPDTRVLDLGAGYGGSARFISSKYGCRVTCLNLSEVQNERNRRMNREQGLTEKLEVLDGSFEEVPCGDASFDVVWSQDSILHSGNRVKVLQETRRVLKPGGVFVFTDPMQKEGVQPGEIRPVLDRIHLETMGSIEFYRRELLGLGFEELDVEVLTPHLVTHYSRVLREIESREEELSKACSREYLDRMKQGLGHWIDAGGQGKLEWGILVFQKARG